MKKLFAFLKFIIVGTIWSYLYLMGTLILFKNIWGFNYLSQSSWTLISDFWNLGGKIKSGSDYCFVISLILLIPLWIIGWKKAYRTHYIKLLISPIIWYQDRSAAKYIKNISRTKIKNIGISIGEEIKQDFENKLKAQEDIIKNSSKDSQKIRANLQRKLANKQ